MINLVLFSFVQAQQTLPDPIQIYRFIKFTSDERAGDMRWIEIWESRSGLDHELVMIDARGSTDGVECNCYHALALGGGTPLYTVNNEYVPVDSADTLFSEIQNRRLIDQSELYVAGIDCITDETDIINGFPAGRCLFQNVDAANLFLVTPPATSQGVLWIATDGGFPVQYHFSADGSTGTVEHRYELIQPPSGFTITPPDNVNLMCFEDGFPIAPNTHVMSTGLSYAVFESDSIQSQLQIYFDNQLIPTWTATGNLPNGGRTYSRTLETGSECSMNIRFGEGPNNSTIISVDVYPQFVNVASFNLPDDFASPVLIQDAFNVPLTIDGTVQDAINQLVPPLEEQGWIQRPELSEVRQDSAFITLRQNEYEMHIIADTTGDHTTVRIQTRAAICGPIFLIGQ